MSTKLDLTKMETHDAGFAFVVTDDRGQIATFWGSTGCSPAHEEASENAMAFIRGPAALEKLERIRSIMRQQNVKRSVMWKQIAEEVDDG